MEQQGTDMITGCYRIMDMTVRITLPADAVIPGNFKKFEVEDCKSGEPDAEYTIEYTEDIYEVAEALKNRQKGTFSISRDNFHLFYTEDGECRFMSLQGKPVFYGISLLGKNGVCRVWFDVRWKPLLNHDTVFCSLFSLEKCAIQKSAMILHSAYICHQGQAILFSAPSGTGKSTQADLWEKYRGAKTVNGDRSFLAKRDGRWYASGWPVCGSSEICYNETFPIKAIVMLRQSKTNRVTRPGGIAAFGEVMSQITINSWDRGFQMKVMDLLEQLLADVPVYVLECDISEEAVACLERAL